MSSYLPFCVILLVFLMSAISFYFQCCHYQIKCLRGLFFLIIWMSVNISVTIMEFYKLPNEMEAHDSDELGYREILALRFMSSQSWNVRVQGVCFGKLYRRLIWQDSHLVLFLPFIDFGLGKVYVHKIILTLTGQPLIFYSSKCLWREQTWGIFCCW